MSTHEYGQINGEQHNWMVAVLSNDEASTDEELRAHFIAGGVPAPMADIYLARRNDYLTGRL
jgi:hypothetical protein